MPHHIRVKKTLTDIALIALTFLPILSLLYLSWIYTGTPQGDGIIQDLFTVLYYQDTTSFIEKIDSTWWSYTQHRAIVSKIAVLLLYFISGHISLQVIGIIGTISLCGMVALLAQQVIHHKLSSILIPTASLILLSPYFWTLITWPETTIFYYGTLFLSFLCFWLLDRKEPLVIPAMICSWLATLTMANGILSIVIASLIIIHQQVTKKKYHLSQLVLWTSGSALCVAFHLVTTNVFSPDVYGAKTLAESFVGIEGRLVDFLESMGSIPLPTHQFREGKILLGCVFTGLVAILAYPRRVYASATITGLMLFCTGTLFLTSLFRYSAGNNDGFQVFTTTNIVAILILGTGQINKAWITTLTLATAIALNINALTINSPKMKDKNSVLSENLESFLINGKEKKIDNWIKVILQDSIKKNVYRPLAHHSTLKNINNIKETQECAAKPYTSTSTMTQTTSNTAFAIKISTTPISHLDSNHLTLILCGSNKNYQADLSTKNIELVNNESSNVSALLDKRLFAPGEYTVYLGSKTKTIVMAQNLNISAVEYPNRVEYDCKIMKETFGFKQKAFAPMINYYCSGKQ